MMKRLFLSFVFGSLVLYGCAGGIAPVLMGSTVGGGTGVGMKYFIGNRVEKTFAVSMAEVEQAALDTFLDLSINAYDHIYGDGKVGIQGRSSHNDFELFIDVTIVEMTDKLTKLAIQCRRKNFIPEPSVAGKIMDRVSERLIQSEQG